MIPDRLQSEDRGVLLSNHHYKVISGPPAVSLGGGYQAAVGPPVPGIGQERVARDEPLLDPRSVACFNRLTNPGVVLGDLL